MRTNNNLVLQLNTASVYVVDLIQTPPAKRTKAKRAASIKTELAEDVDRLLARQADLARKKLREQRLERELRRDKLKFQRQKQQEESEHRAAQLELQKRDIRMREDDARRRNEQMERLIDLLLNRSSDQR